VEANAIGVEEGECVAVKDGKGIQLCVNPRLYHAKATIAVQKKQL
jgi:hypothetical protein